METHPANAEPTAPPVQPVRPVRGLACPRCSGAKWKVLSTRTAVHGLRRHRKCASCGAVFRSVERLEAVPVAESVICSATAPEPSLPRCAEP